MKSTFAVTAVIAAAISQVAAVECEIRGFPEGNVGNVAGLEGIGAPVVSEDKTKQTWNNDFSFDIASRVITVSNIAAYPRSVCVHKDWVDYVCFPINQGAECTFPLADWESIAGWTLWKTGETPTTSSALPTSTPTSPPAL
ncbi:hypothetical protein CTRI78_v008048 [Colletotrichum trifolii]|uniref:Uncharacterized protein n=1 Tax=Colletotrichum trifolii TaxID=5466 RepID=A0A4R8R1C1_COLTR|nr:hypothetical protein CTRI78_v008048 [Colletotrichum trifolii]